MVRQSKMCHIRHDSSVTATELIDHPLSAPPLTLSRYDVCTSILCFPDHRKNLKNLLFPKKREDRTGCWYRERLGGWLTFPHGTRIGSCESLPALNETNFQRNFSLGVIFRRRLMAVSCEQRCALDCPMKPCGRQCKRPCT